MKRVIHKETTSGVYGLSWHLCGNDKYYSGWDGKRVISDACCSRLWKNVTCKKCLKMRGKKK
jgi:hypothetical protein